jgi:hypothetical protein
MASLYSALFIYVCISLLLPSHVAEYYATTAYASRENSKGTDYITDFYALPIMFTRELLNFQWEKEDTTLEARKKPRRTRLVRVEDPLTTHIRHQNPIQRPDKSLGRRVVRMGTARQPAPVPRQIQKRANCDPRVARQPLRTRRNRLRLELLKMNKVEDPFRGLGAACRRRREDLRTPRNREATRDATDVHEGMTTLSP